MNIFALHSNPKSKKKYWELANSIPAVAWIESDIAVSKNSEQQFKDALKEKEHIWAKSAKYSYMYADLIGERFPAGEEAISKDIVWANRYVFQFIKDRWPLIEPLIMSRAEYASTYAIYIIKGRWEEAEPIIATDAYNALSYAVRVLKARFPLGDSLINKYFEGRFSILNSADYDKYKSFPK